jgi:glycosyltransferase involved in cell wall biosynthesis
MRLLGETQHDAIVVSGPPFSSFLVGAALSRRTGLPLVLDYRDEWDLSNAYWENKRLGPLSRCVQRQMQHRVVRQASALVATTRSSALALEAIRRRAGSSARVTWIYNGYDPEDFSGPLPSPAAPGGSFRLVYVGTLWEMTSVAPLVNAVSRLARHAPGQAGALELVFAGRRTAPQQQVIEGLRGLPCRVVEQPYVDHDKAVALLRSADALCALLSDLPGVGRVVPAKIFEYLAARKPVLTIAPRGDLWDLLEGCPRAARFLPADDEGVAGWLEAQIRGRAAGAVFDDGEWEGSRFNRKHQAGQLATLLEGLC